VLRRPSYVLTDNVSVTKDNFSGYISTFGIYNNSSFSSFKSINGRVFGNIDGFDMCIGDKVSWHVIGFGERFDLNAYVFEGNNVRYDGIQVNYVYVLPGRGETVYMKPDNPGR